MRSATGFMDIISPLASWKTTPWSMVSCRRRYLSSDCRRTSSALFLSVVSIRDSTRPVMLPSPSFTGTRDQSQ